MRFTLAYFVVAIVMALLTPVAHSLPSKTVSARDDTSSTGPVNDTQACIEACYSSSKEKLGRSTLFSDLVESDCTYQNRANSNLPSSCSEPREAFKGAIIEILNVGEECRSGCLKDHTTANPSFRYWEPCYDFKIRENDAYMKECWEAAKTSIFEDQFEDVCTDIWLPRFQAGRAFCQMFPRRNS